MTRVLLITGARSLADDRAAEVWARGLIAARAAAEALQRAAVAAAEHMRGGAKAMADVAAAVRPKAKRAGKAKGRAKR